MSAKLVDDIANAVLYEGYLLYPYRALAHARLKLLGFLHDRLAIISEHSGNVTLSSTFPLPKVDVNAVGQAGVEAADRAHKG